LAESPGQPCEFRVGQFLDLVETLKAFAGARAAGSPPAFFWLD
jgi:hypothetical protein